jgi:hypothetical protein
MVARNYACVSRAVAWYVGHEQEVNPILVLILVGGETR